MSLNQILLSYGCTDSKVHLLHSMLVVGRNAGQSPNLSTAMPGKDTGHSMGLHQFACISANSTHTLAVS